MSKRVFAYIKKGSKNFLEDWKCLERFLLVWCLFHKIISFYLFLFCFVFFLSLGYGIICLIFPLVWSWDILMHFFLLLVPTYHFGFIFFVFGALVQSLNLYGAFLHRKTNPFVGQNRNIPFFLHKTNKIGSSHFAFEFRETFFLFSFLFSFSSYFFFPF